MDNISERIDQSSSSSSQRLLLALDEAIGKLEAVERSKTEPIAIIGMGCRFPGGANDPEAFWQLLINGVDAITEVPTERWDINAYYDPNSDTPGKMYSRYGGFLQQVDQFDPQFFGISPREALAMDPQQRLLLEVSWEALENAAQMFDRLSGSQTGVFVGITINDYMRHLMQGGEQQIDAYFMTGNALNAAAGRLSYTLGLTGPSMAIDTACSSSLVALHVACQSLRQGECRQALAGGVNLTLAPEPTIALSQARMVSKSGRCKTFDASADGIVRGEGCGMLVLKRLSDALADGDNILALIRSSAVNQDGPSSGFTVPNKAAQETLLRLALTRAKIEPSLVDYVEAHGTGTSLGDPIEVRALGSVFAEGRTRERPLLIGSLKTNIGHLESAAGVASVIKVVLSLQHEQIPPHLHLQQPNPYINWDELPVSVTTEATKWAAGGKRRIAGVSSFGASGTNAHVVLEEAPTPAPLAQSPQRPLHLLTLSAKTNEALVHLAQQYQQHLTANPALAVEDICFTTNTGRRHFNYRLSVLGTITQVGDKLASFVRGEENPEVIQGQVEGTTPPKVAFLFTGQGSQYVEMGRQLYETQPTFRRTLERCDEILRPYLDQSLLQVLYPDSGYSSPLHKTAYTQPALFAVEYALAQLWLSWGIKPAVVIGHSVGEYVAACVAGVFSLEDGLKLIAERGRLMQTLPQTGEMLAVFADHFRVASAIQPYAEEVAIAAINGPESVVISGKQQVVKVVRATLEGAGVKTKPLQVSHAFHSPLMQPMVAAFARIAGQVSYCSPKTPIISNITGKLATSDIATPEYWCDQITQPVRFAASMEMLQQQSCEILVEIGPKPTLLGMGRDCLPVETTAKYAFLPSLRPGQSDWQQLLDSLGQLYVRGFPIDWSGFDRDYPRRRMVLPTYPFQRQRCWMDIPSEKHEKDRLSLEIAQSPILKLLHQGDTEQLTQQLVTTGELSADELKLLPRILEVLVKQHHQKQLTPDNIPDWLYEVNWQQKPDEVLSAQVAKQFKQPSSWLIFADRGGVGQALAALLQQQGHHCILVYAKEAKDAACQPATGAWSLNPESIAQFQHLLREVVANSQLPLRGVLHLWSLEAGQTEELTLATLEQAQIFGCASVLHLVQALVETQNFASMPRLWLVTRGAMPVDSLPPAVAQAPLWGLGKVVALEHPELWGGLVDLAPEANAGEAAALLAEIEDAQGEDHVAFRQVQRYVARLVPSKSPKRQELSLRSDSTYLITGGLGGLGLLVAQWMVKQGVKYLVLTGRHEASQQTQEVIAQMQQQGVRVRVAHADVSNEQELSLVLEEIQAAMPPLLGIVHAAGVLDDGMLLKQNWERFKGVMAAKLKGAWNLHVLTQKLPLDFLVFFSSAAALLGSPSQANYAAANSFMDALAHYRHRLGLPALSINWGPWKDFGMVTDLNSHHQARLASRGMSLIGSEQGLRVLERLLGATSPQVGVLPIDWSLFGQQFSFGVQSPLLFEIIHKVTAREEPDQMLVQRHEFLEQLKSANASDRQKLLIAFIQNEAAKLLGFSQSQLPNPRLNFFDMGMDSLMAIEFKNNLEKNLGQSLSSTLVFNYPTIEAVGNYLYREVIALDKSDITNASLLKNREKLSKSLEGTEQLSESEIMAFIDEEFKTNQ